MVASQSIARDLVTSIARRRQAASYHCDTKVTTTSSLVSALLSNAIFLRSIFLPKFFVVEARRAKHECRLRQQPVS
jgi:hypothetical protein